MALWGTVEGDGRPNATVWRPAVTSVRGWREATVFLGRIPGPFQLYFHSQRRWGLRGDVAIDQLKFQDCALPGEGVRRDVCVSTQTAGQDIKLHIEEP